MARINGGIHQETFKMNTHDGNGPHEPKTAKHPINQRKDT
jgi:hypothetical protein